MNRQGLAWWVLALAMAAILAVGFWLGATHRESRPDGGAPAASGSQD